MTTPEKVNKPQEKTENCVCSECDNADCKCHQIMVNLSENIDLSNQIGHDILHNIFLTIFVTLQHLSDHEEDLIKIANACQEVYKDLNPKEMGYTLN